MYFCIMNYIRTKGEVCRQLKIFLNPLVVYATDRSKAMVTLDLSFNFFGCGPFWCSTVFSLPV